MDKTQALERLDALEKLEEQTKREREELRKIIDAPDTPKLKKEFASDYCWTVSSNGAAYVPTGGRSYVLACNQIGNAFYTKKAAEHRATVIRATAPNAWRPREGETYEFVGRVDNCHIGVCTFTNRNDDLDRFIFNTRPVFPAGTGLAQKHLDEHRATLTAYVEDKEAESL